MKNYVLVHGSYHGAWCFDRLVLLLQNYQHNAIAVQLPYPTKDKAVITMTDCIDALHKSIHTCNEKVILVGHSSAGQIISNFAEYYPEKIQTLIYLTATLLPAGYSNMDIPRKSDEIPHSPYSICNTDYKTLETKRAYNRKIIYEYFYNDCSFDIAEDAIHFLIRYFPMPCDTAGFYYFILIHLITLRLAYYRTIFNITIFILCQPFCCVYYRIFRPYTSYNVIHRKAG